MSLGSFIAKKRKYMRLTQEQLAEKVNVSKSAIAKWETDGGVPERDNLKNLARVLMVSVEDLYRIIENKENEGTNRETNITQDVIAVLESYGYKVIKPANKNDEMEENKE